MCQNKKDEYCFHALKQWSSVVVMSYGRRACASGQGIAQNLPTVTLSHRLAIGPFILNGERLWV